VAGKILQRRVRDRAKAACEYCHLPEAAIEARFHLEHIIARQHGGERSLENLALACPSCNRHKGPNVAGIDPSTSSLSELFNPRRHNWTDHFYWEGTLLRGSTAIGRATIQVLAINGPLLVGLRDALAEEGLWPLR
jgi:hypothetical protein